MRLSLNLNIQNYYLREKPRETIQLVLITEHQCRVTELVWGQTSPLKMTSPPQSPLPVASQLRVGPVKDSVQVMLEVLTHLIIHGQVKTGPAQMASPSSISTLSDLPSEMFPELCGMGGCYRCAIFS